MPVVIAVAGYLTAEDRLQPSAHDRLTGHRRVRAGFRSALLVN